MKSYGTSRKTPKNSGVLRFKSNVAKEDENNNSDDDVYVQSSVELSDNGLIKMLTDEIQYNIDGLINAGSSVTLKRDCVEKVFDKVASSRQIMMALRANGMATDLLKLPALLNVEKDFYIGIYLFSLVYVLSLTKNSNAVSLEMPDYTFTALLSTIFAPKKTIPSTKRKASGDGGKPSVSADGSPGGNSVESLLDTACVTTKALTPGDNKKKFHKRRKMHSAPAAAPGGPLSFDPFDVAFGEEPPVSTAAAAAAAAALSTDPEDSQVVLPCSAGAYLYEPETSDAGPNSPSASVDASGASGVTKELWYTLFHGLLIDRDGDLLTAGQASQASASASASDSTDASTTTGSYRYLMVLPQAADPAAVLATVQGLFGLYIVNRFLFNKVQKIASDDIAQVGGNQQSGGGMEQDEGGGDREEARQLEIELKYLSCYQHMLRGHASNGGGGGGGVQRPSGGFFRDIFAIIHEDCAHVCRATKDAWRSSRLYICLGLIESACFRCVENELTVATMKMSQLGVSPSSPAVSPALMSAPTPMVLGAVYVFEFLNSLTGGIFCAVNDMVYAMQADLRDSPSGASPSTYHARGKASARTPAPAKRTGIQQFLPELVVSSTISPCTVSAIDIWLVALRALVNMTHSSGGSAGASAGRTSTARAVGAKLIESGCLRWCVVVMKQISLWNADIRRLGVSSAGVNGNMDTNGEIKTNVGIGGSPVRNSKALSPEESVVDKIVYDCTLFVLALLTNLTPVIKQCCRGGLKAGADILPRSDRVDLVSSLVSVLLCESETFMGIIIDTDSKISSKPSPDPAVGAPVATNDTCFGSNVLGMAENSSSSTSSPLSPPPTAGRHKRNGANTNTTPSPSSSQRSVTPSAEGDSLPIAEINLTGHVALVLFHLAYDRSDKSGSGANSSKTCGANRLDSKETSVDVEFNRLVCDRLPHGSWWLPIRVLKGFLALQSKTGVIMADTVYPIIEAIHTLENYHQCAGQAQDVSLLLGASASGSPGSDGEAGLSPEVFGAGGRVRTPSPGVISDGISSGGTTASDTTIGPCVTAKPNSAVFAGVASIFDVNDTTWGAMPDASSTGKPTAPSRHASVTSLVYKRGNLFSGSASMDLQTEGESESTPTAVEEVPSPTAGSRGKRKSSSPSASQKAAQMIFSNQYSVSAKASQRRGTGTGSQSPRFSSPLPTGRVGSSDSGGSSTDGSSECGSSAPRSQLSVGGAARMRYGLSSTKLSAGVDVDSPMSTTSSRSHISGSSSLSASSYSSAGTSIKAKNKNNGWRSKLVSSKSDSSVDNSPTLWDCGAKPVKKVLLSPLAAAGPPPEDVFDFDFP